MEVKKQLADLGDKVSDADKTKVNKALADLELAALPVMKRAQRQVYAFA